MRPHLFLLFAWCLFQALWSHAAEPAATPRETVFVAFDDQNIAWQHNLKVTLVSPEKHPATNTMFEFVGEALKK